MTKFIKSIIYNNILIKFMTILTHLISGAVAGKLLTDNIELIVVTVIGSIFPDVFEMILAGRNWKQFFKIHRKFFHWFGFYIILLLLSMFVFVNKYLIFIDYFLYGCLIHLFMDLFTPSGIPVGPFGLKKVAIPMCKTGSYREFGIFSILLIILILIYY